MVFLCVRVCVCVFFEPKLATVTTSRFEKGYLREKNNRKWKFRKRHGFVSPKRLSRIMIDQVVFQLLILFCNFHS